MKPTMRLYNTPSRMIKIKKRPDSVAHACNPSILGGQGRRITWVQEFKTSLGNIGRFHLYKKLARLGGICLWPQLLGRLRQEDHLNQEAEVAGSQDHAIALQLGQQSETRSQKTKNKKMKNNMINAKIKVHTNAGKDSRCLNTCALR